MGNLGSLFSGSLTHRVSPFEGIVSDQQSLTSEPLGLSGVVQGASNNQDFDHWRLTPSTAESLENIYANIGSTDETKGRPLNMTLDLDNFGLSMGMVQQPGMLLAQLPMQQEHDSDSNEENEAESDVIEQLSNHIGTLKIAGDGHLRFYGATSKLELGGCVCNAATAAPRCAHCAS